MNPGKINILIADNQFLITDTLIRIIQSNERLNFIGLAESAEELRSLLAKHPETNLIITDYHLLDYSGLDELESVKLTYPTAKILILTNQVKVSEINEFNKAGIKNIVYKTTGYKDLLEAIEFTNQGKKYYSEEILDMLIENKTDRNEVIAPAILTPAEIEITKLIANGLTTKEIASEKHISTHTVMAHRKNIFRKLNIKNTSELIMYAIKAGLIDNIEYYI